MQLPLSSCLEDFVLGPVLFFISDHPAFFSSSVKVSFDANNFAIWASSPNVDVQLPLSSCLEDFVLGPVLFFISDHPAFFSSSVKVSFDANNFAIWASSPNVDVQLPLSSCLEDFVLGPVLFLLSVITLLFFPHPLKSLSMLTISLYGPRPQTLTCNCHYQAALKILFLDQSFFLSVITLLFFPHPLKSLSMLTISLFGPPPQTLTCNCHCQAALKILFLDQSFFLSVITLLFFPHPLKSLSMLTISLYGPRPQTLTCNCHCQAALKILFLDQSFFYYQ